MGLNSLDAPDRQFIALSANSLSVPTIEEDVKERENLSQGP